ncbi:hypothetical protein [Paraburkholderia sp. NMBU_R16]|nr:hypothetical protein [Paraburkholderia sp. NMBU_R16]
MTARRPVGGLMFLDRTAAIEQCDRVASLPVEKRLPMEPFEVT